MARDPSRPRAWRRLFVKLFVVAFVGAACVRAAPRFVRALLRGGSRLR